MNPSVLFWAVTAFLFGITIGSFLNAVIYRLPHGLTLLEPRHSICPKCTKTLSAIDLVPLFSFLLLGAKCRQCKAPIAWRYFWVELITGALFVALTLRYPPLQHTPDWIALLCFTAVLVPVFCIDLDTFTIPNSLNILLFVIPVARDAWGIVHHEPGHALLWAWLPPSILGGLAGALIFGVIRVVGWIWKRIEAMGLGDVLLARGMGAMLISLMPLQTVGTGSPFYGLRLFPAWVMLSVISGLIIGVGLLWLRRPQESAPQQGAKRAAVTTETEPGPRQGDGSSLARELKEIAWCLSLGDLWEYLGDLVRHRRAGPSEQPSSPSETTAVFEDEWVPASTAIPFGPFLVIGFLATVFVGEWLTAAYLAYALHKEV